MAKFKIELNNIDNIRELLQNAYEASDSQIVQAQSEINKLANSTKLQDVSIQEKKDYAKAINDYLNVKDKAISKKLEIAKLMSDICKNGNEAQKENEVASFSSFNFDNIRDILDNESNKTETFKLNK